MASVEHQSSFGEKVDTADLVLFSKSIQEEEGVDETNCIEIKQEHLDEGEKHSSNNGSGFYENRLCDNVSVPMSEEFQNTNKTSKSDQNGHQTNISVEACKVTMWFLLYLKI